MEAVYSVSEQGKNSLVDRLVDKGIPCNVSRSIEHRWQVVVENGPFSLPYRVNLLRGL